MKQVSELNLLSKKPKAMNAIRRNELNKLNSKQEVTIT